MGGIYMSQEVYNLITGIDPGNTSTKVSYLNGEGNIDSFMLSTVCAPADEKGDPLSANAQQRDFNDTDRLHVHIQSKSVPRTYYFVGDWARNKENMMQPEAEISDKHNSELHTVTTLTGLAIAALRIGQENVDLQYSGGLPIEEHKRVDANQVLERYKGSHSILFMDGKYKNKRVVLNINGGQVHVEGVTSSLGLKYDIQNKGLIPLESGSQIGDVYGLGDLGAGTTDLALYDEDGLNGYVSTNLLLGTNKFIDDMVEEIFNLKAFEEVKSFLKERNLELIKYRNREEFLREVIFPGVDLILKDKNPKFTVSWARVQEVDVTVIVLKHMKNYYDKVLGELREFWYVKAPKVKTFPLVGGGILFAYYYFKDVEGFSLPTKELIKEAPFITSRAYLIANYVNQLAD
jgi:plasmid segregation protein ParM